MNLKPARVGVSGDGADNTAPHEFLQHVVRLRASAGFSAMHLGSKHYQIKRTRFSAHTGAEQSNLMAVLADSDYFGSCKAAGFSPASRIALNRRTHGCTGLTDRPCVGPP